MVELFFGVFCWLHHDKTNSFSIFNLKISKMSWQCHYEMTTEKYDLWSGNFCLLFIKAVLFLWGDTVLQSLDKSKLLYSAFVMFLIKFYQHICGFVWEAFMILRWRNIWLLNATLRFSLWIKVDTEINC